MKKVYLVLLIASFSVAAHAQSATEEATESGEVKTECIAEESEEANKEQVKKRKKHNSRIAAYYSAGSTSDNSPYDFADRKKELCSTEAN